MAERAFLPANRPPTGHTSQPALNTWRAGPQLTTSPEIVDPAIVQSGAPLDPVLRREMEGHFGYDFSKVRVHSGARASQSAHDLGARAYTIGQDIVVGGGGRSEGAEARRLIAHELGHVVQQSSDQSSAAVIQRQVDPDAREPWTSLTPSGRKAAQALNDDCMWWIGQLVKAQMAHPSTLRSAWLNFLSQNLLGRIGALARDAGIAPLQNVLTDVTDGYLRTVARADEEWLALEQRYRDERQALLPRDPSTDAVEAVKDLDEKYKEAKRWLERGAFDYITEDDYATLKDTLDHDKHLRLGVLRGSRIREAKLNEMLRTVAELRRDGEDADKFVPSWQERVDYEANNLDRLAATMQATLGFDYPAEFRRMRLELLEKKAETLRAHKPTKGIAERAVDFVVGGAEAVVGPFVEAAREVEDLTKIAMHFATLGKYEPKFSSDMAEAARQGQGTGDLLKGMAKGLIQTPERFVNAVEAGDWEAIGRETVNLYMLAKTIKEAPEMVEKIPGLLAKTRRGLRLLKARKLAIELNESRLIPTRGPIPAQMPAPAAPPVPAAPSASATPTGPPSTAPRAPSGVPPRPGGGPAQPVTLGRPPTERIGFRPPESASPTPAPAAAPKRPIGFQPPNRPALPDPPTGQPTRPSPQVAGFGREPRPAAPTSSAPMSRPIDTQVPPAKRLPTTPEPRGPRAMADEPKPTSEPKQTAQPGHVEPADPGGGPAPASGETVPRRRLREELRANLERRVREKKAVVDDLAAEKGVIDRRLKAINDRIRATSDPTELRTLQAERRRLIDERVGSQGSQEVADDWLEAKRLLKATEGDYFDALSGSASKRRGYGKVRARKRDEVFGTTGRRLEVEHVYPRSRIFNTPGFEKLTWDQQVALFNYEPNLKLIPADINLARSTTPYASWKGASRFPEITPSAISDLAVLEARMEKEIGAMIKKPSLIPVQDF